MASLHKLLSKQEAYSACTERMERAAEKIRNLALNAGLGFQPAMMQPISPQGGWGQEHQYWLYCMHFVEQQPETAEFHIEGGFLHINTGTSLEKVYYQG